MTNMATSGQFASSDTLDCPACQNLITYYDVSGSSYYGCPRCHTFFKYENEEPPEILTTFPEIGLSIVLPIGTEGYLNNQFVRVAGFMHKKEAGAAYTWSEYMLLQKDGSTIQLSEYNGHWMVIEPTAKTYSHYHVGGKTYYIQTDNRQYWLYNRYKAEVLNAIGEFDWNILEDVNLTISEYIQPPNMLVGEQSENQTRWYKGQHISRKDLATAFGMSENNLPSPIGVGAIQPADPTDRGGVLLAFTAMLVVAMLVLQVVISIVKPSKQLLSDSYQAESDSAGTVRPIITPSFDLNTQSALAINLSATLDNQWLELPVTLINEQSGRVYEFSKTLEHYHGVESGESWSEGTDDDEAILSRVPAGRYHLNVYPAREPGQSVTFRIIVRENPFLGSNMALLLLLLVIYPVFRYIQKQWHESQRWSNSDYSKVFYSESDN